MAGVLGFEPRDPTILENTTDKEERFVMFFAVSATTT